MSESDVSDSKHEECGDPGPGLGEARPGVLVVCGQGGYCWPWRRLQLGWEAGAGAGLGHATSSVRLHLILAEPGPRPPARQQHQLLELGTNLHEV